MLSSLPSLIIAVVAPKIFIHTSRAIRLTITQSLTVLSIAFRQRQRAFHRIRITYRQARCRNVAQLDRVDHLVGGIAGFEQPVLVQFNVAFVEKVKAANVVG